MKKIIKILVLLSAVLLVLSLCAYWYLTSERFIKAQVLPRLSDSVGYPVTAERVSFSPFRSIEMSGVKIGSEKDMRISVGTLRGAYRFFPLLRGNVIVNEITLRDVDIDIVELPVTADDEKTDDKSAEDGRKASWLPAVSISNVQIRNANVAVHLPGGGIVTINDAHLSIPHLQTGGDFRIESKASIHLLKEAVALEIANATFQADGVLAKDGMPVSLKANADLSGVRGNAGGTDLGGHGVSMETEIRQSDNKYEIVKGSIIELHQGEQQAMIECRGLFGLEPLSANLTLTVALAQPGLLNLAAGLVGDYDFGRTSLDFLGGVDLDEAGLLKTNGKLAVGNLTLESRSKGIKALAPLQINADYDLALDLAGETLAMQRFSISASTDQPVLSFWLDEPVTLNMQEDERQTQNGRSATIRGKIDALNLDLVRPMIPVSPEFELLGGIMSGEMFFEIAESGRTVNAEVKVAVADAAVRLQTTVTEQLSMQHEMNISLSNFNCGQLTRGNLVIQKRAGSGELVTVLVTEATGTFTLDPLTFDLEVETRLSALDELLGMHPVADGISLGDAGLVLNVSTQLRDGGSELEMAGKMTLTGMRISHAPSGFITQKALDVKSEIDLKAHMAETSMDVVVSTLVAKVLDADKVIIDAGLGKPLRLWLNDKIEVLAETSVAIKIRNLSLPDFAEFMKPELEVLSGSLDAVVDVTIPESSFPKSKMTMDLSRLSIKTGASVLLPVDLALTLDAAIKSAQELTIAPLTIRAGGKNDPLIDFQIDGNLTTGSGKSELRARSRNRIDVERLISLIAETDQTTRSSEKKTAAPSATAETAPVPAADEPLWISAVLDIPEVVYRRMLIRDVHTTAEYRNGVLNVPQVLLGINGGQVSGNARMDWSSPDNASYAGSMSIASLELAPVVQSFLPDLPLSMNGQLSRAAFNFSTHGLTTPELLKALDGKMSFGLDDIAINEIGGWGGALASQLLGFFELSPSELIFSGGNGELAMNSGTFKLEAINLIGKLTKFGFSGEMKPGGSPDLTIVPAFKGALAEKLLAEGLRLKKSADGFMEAPPLKLEGPIWEKKHAMTLALHYGVTLGKVDPKYQAFGEGVGIITDIFKKEPSDSERQPGGVVKDALDIYDRYRSQKENRDGEKEQSTEPQSQSQSNLPPADAPAATKAPAPPEEKPASATERRDSRKKAVESILRGILQPE